MNDNSKGNMKINGFIKNVFGGTDIYNASTKNTNQGAGSTETHGRKEDVEQKFQDNQKAVVYNLIILDESGSMSGVTGQTIHGCNETLNGIRTTACEDKEQRQFVSIYCFDTTNPRYIFQNIPIEEVRDLTSTDYCPNACTPLYDAIGFTVSHLKDIATDSNSIGKVTIITDGYENASKKWNHSSVVELIEGLKKKGWLFTFMGANIDVENTSRSLGIDSFMEFQQTDDGMRVMFECERRSQRAYSKKMAFMRRCQCFANASEEEREKMLSSLNENYFTDDERIAPNVIQFLASNEVFVFGSNPEGIHNGGSAYVALQKFGAQMGIGEGIQGQSYAIPTTGCSFNEVKKAIDRFTEYAALHPQKKFILTAIGCGNAGYTPDKIAPLFKQAYEFGNVYVPITFYSYVR